MKRIIPVLLVSLFIISCSVQRATIHSFTETSINTENVKTIAFFPIRGGRLLTTETRMINQLMIDSFTFQNPQVEIIEPATAVSLLSEYNFSDKYADFLTNYSLSGIPNSTTLKEIGDSLQVDAILQGELLDIEQRDGVYGVQTGRTALVLSYALWSCEEGVLLWEATSQAEKTTITKVEAAPPLIDVVLMAHEKILQSLPKLAE